MADLIQIPQSGQWVLAADTCLTPKALAQGHIIIEQEIRDLPAVRRLRPGDVVLDVGAFVGDTAAIFLNLGCEVWAFEPYADAFECLQRNCPQAHCVNAAVGDGRPVRAAGETLSPGGNHGMRVVSPTGDVPSVRLDDLDLSRVDFVKIDVEGFEPAVLDGMTKLIERLHPPIYIEVYDEALARHGFTREDVMGRLRAAGYRWTVIGHEYEHWFNLICTAGAA